jgi:hypothetical protein
LTARSLAGRRLTGRDPTNRILTRRILPGRPIWRRSVIGFVHRRPTVPVSSMNSSGMLIGTPLLATHGPPLGRRKG